MTTSRADWVERSTPNLILYRKLSIATWILTVAVMILVGLMNQPNLKIPLPDGVHLDFLPLAHAVLNSLVAVCLLAGMVSIMLGKVKAHQRWLTSAMVLSVLFLLCYVAYHFTNVEVKYGDVNRDGIISIAEQAAVGSMRTIYLCLLASHIIIAGISFPFILLAFSAAWSHCYAKHRRLVHWAFPMWLYVAITGPICYWLLKPYY